MVVRISIVNIQRLLGMEVNIDIHIAKYKTEGSQLFTEFRNTVTYNKALTSVVNSLIDQQPDQWHEMYEIFQSY